MKRALFLLTVSFFCLQPMARAQAKPSSSMQDAFYAYAKMRRLQHLNELLPFADEEEDAKLKEAQKLSAELSQARIDFYAIARSDQELLSAWEQGVLKRLEKQGKAPSAIDKDALDFLSSAFPKAKSFTLVEWEIVREWFGKKTEEAFLKTTFAARELPAKNAIPKGDGATVLWVSTYSPENSLTEKAGQKNETLRLKKSLIEAGYKFEILELSPFARADDQATELVQAISQRKDEPVILVSENKAGAVIYRALDILPGLRKNTKITGWVNLNGYLFGEAPDVKRAPASLASDPIAASTAEGKIESYRLYRENIEQTPPLVKGFPILNVISLEGKNRRTSSLRESVVPDGSTWLAPAGTPTLALPSALSLFGQGTDAGLRDSISDSGF
ncbi:MAG: hypothetical protein ACXWQO_09640 [Bdellovibrionota bacterium]